MKARNVLILLTTVVMMGITTESTTNVLAQNTTHTEHVAKHKKHLKTYKDMSENQVGALIAQELLADKNNNVPKTITNAYDNDNNCYVLAQGESNFSVMYTVKKDKVTVNSDSRVGAGQEFSINKLIKKYDCSKSEKSHTKMITKMINKNAENMTDGSSDDCCS